jgi:inner membrane protein
MVGLALGLGLALYTREQPINALAIAALTSAAAVLPDIDLRLGIKHRGITHTAAALLTIFGLSGVVPEIGATLDYVLMGYASHLFVDMLTPHGIPLLYPVVQRNVRLARFRTGGVVDHGLGIVAAAVAVVLLWRI